MKLVFAHDHIFYKYKNQYYSTGGLSKEVLERYTQVYDEVVVISRQKKIEKINTDLTLASTKNVEFVEIPNFKTIKNYLSIFRANKKIKKELIASDLLIARLPSSIGSLSVTIAKKINKPYLIELVGCPFDSYWHHSLKGKIVAPYYYLETKRKVKKAKYVVYVTNKFLQKRYPTNGESVNCSNVYLTNFNDSILNSRIEKINKLDQNSKIVLGTIAAVDVKYKGQKYVIQALGKLKKQGITNFEYQLVGAGDQTYLKSIAKKYDVIEQIVFLGSLPHKKVFKWLDTIDVYTQPSRTEGLPRSLIEAMSRGLPAFGANTAGIPELLENKFIFSNTKANIDEICNILKQINKQTMMSQAKRNFEEAKKYDKKIIDNRRKKFFIKFKENNYYKI